jgi:hypothetical protein
MSLSPELTEALELAREVLAEQHANCGGGESTIYHEPLQKIDAALASLKKTGAQKTRVRS